MDDDWRVDNGLATLRAKIYAILPTDWTFYGPIRQADGQWRVGCRPMKGPVEAGCFATSPDLVTAFRHLADGIDALNLPPGLSN